MSWVAAAIGGSALLGAYTSNKAAGQQADAANNATATQQGMFDKTYAAGQPYRDTGAAASGRLQDLLGLSGNTGAEGYGSLGKTFTGADYLANQDPGYQFQLNQGQQALQNSQAAQGGVLSGAALKGLMNYNQDYASTGYNNAFGRFNTQQSNIYNRLGNLATLGQNSAAGAGANGASFANGIAGTITGAGNAAAAGTIGMGNAITGSINNGLGYYQLNSILNPTKTGGTVPGGYSPGGDGGYADYYGGS